MGTRTINKITQETLMPSTKFKKFYQTQCANSLSEYHTMRINESLMLIFYLLQYFKLKNILEFGFYEGQTFGIMIEGTEDCSSLTAVDINYKMDLYNKNYVSTGLIKNKTIQLLQMDTKDFVFDQTYDFINVDDGHLTCRLASLSRAANHVSHNGILMLDNYNSEIQDPTVDKFLKLHHNFVPFLADDQALYFHHKDHNAEDFLDNFIESTMGHVCSLNNMDYKGFLVKHVAWREVNLHQRHKPFVSFCQELDL